MARNTFLQLQTNGIAVPKGKSHWFVLSFHVHKKHKVTIHKCMVINYRSLLDSCAFEWLVTNGVVTQHTAQWS